MTKITSVLIILVFFIEGDSLFQAPQPTSKTDGPIELQRGIGMGYCVGETARLNQPRNPLGIKFQMLQKNLMIKL